MKFCSRKFYTLLFSACIDMVIAFIMTLSDTLVAGHFLGEEAVAAIGIVNPIFSFGVAVSVLFSSGAAVCYNRAMGAFDKEKAHKFFGLGVTIAVIAGIIMFIGTIFVKEFYINSMNPTGEVLTYVNDYFTYYPHILLFYPIYTILSEMVYGDGDETLFTISSLFNVIGNPLVSIILCPIMGIRGISLGSLAGLLIAIASLLPHFFKKSNSVHFKWHLNLKDTATMMKYGINDASQFLCFSVLQYVVTAFAAARFGITAVTILPVIVSIVELSVIFDGVGQAVIPICSVYLGEGNTVGVRSIMKTAKNTAIIMGLSFSVLVIIFAPLIPPALGVDEPELVPMAALGIRIVATTLVFASLKYLLATYYCLRDKLLLSVAIIAQSDMIFPIIIGIPLALVMGLPGIWVGLAAAPILALLLPYFITRRSKGDMLMLKEDDNRKVVSYDITLGEESIIKLRNDVELVLAENGIGTKPTHRVMLMIEESLTLILEKNPDKKIYAECTLIIDDKIHLIIRDSGVIFDITDADMPVKSLKSYVISGIMERQKFKKNLTTISSNRNEFCFEKNEA